MEVKITPDHHGQTGKLPSTVTLTGFGSNSNLSVLVENKSITRYINNQCVTFIYFKIFLT